MTYSVADFLVVIDSLGDFLVVVAAVLLGHYMLRPASTLLHELGHAVPVLVLTDGSIEVFVGGDRWSWSFGRLRIHLDPGRRGGWIDGDWSSTRVEGIAVVAGGPLVTLALFGAAVWVVLASGFFVARAVGVYVAVISFASLARTLYPREYPAGHGALAGDPSDGLRLLRLIRGEVGG